MNEEELLKKIEQIEAQAKDALAEYPTLAKERLRMIISLARYVRTELTHTSARMIGAPSGRESDNDDAPASSRGRDDRRNHRH